MYITVIRPQIEYASEVHTVCNRTVEKVQLHADRNVTGLPVFSSRNYFMTILSLYNETEWEPHFSRRHSKKLTAMNEIA